MKASFVGARRLPRGAASRLRAMLLRLGEALDLEGARVGVLFTNDAGIRAHNARWRDRDEPTDVLSFASDDEPGYLGDLVVSLERAREQASEEGHRLEDEIEVLLLHGVLHLTGHDHETDGGRMRRLEERLAGQILGGTRGLVARSAGARGRRT